MYDPLLLLSGASTVIVCGAVGAMALSCFRKCGPDQAMIVSGLVSSENGPRYKIVKTGGAVIWPVIQQAAYISLAPLDIAVNTETPYITKDDKSVVIHAVARVKVGNDEESIALAAENFLNKSDAQIAAIAQDTLIGHLRAAVGQHTRAELNQNISEITARVTEVSLADLKQFGLGIPSFSIKEISQSPQAPQAAQSDAR